MRNPAAPSLAASGQRPAGRPVGLVAGVFRDYGIKQRQRRKRSPPCGHPACVGMAQDNDRGIGNCEEKVVAPGREDLSGEKPRGALFGQQHELQRLATPVENPASHRCGHEGRKSGVGHAGAECEGRNCRHHAPRAEPHAGDPLGRAAQQPEREIRETCVRLFVRRHGYLTASSFSSRSSRSILSMMVLTSTSISDPGE